ncbi:hypothetical protein PRIPAC_77582 [Pristionchus pacificus]|nr:hypothetical protein PRIPAC_77582 [Pristionchus pacificus]
MFIAVERIRSTFQPQEYHESRASWEVLLVLTIITYSLGAYVGFLIYLNDHHFTGFIIYNAIDLSTLVTNTLGIWYCKKRYMIIYGKASLNARYQAVGMAIAYSYGFMMKLINEPVFALLDSGYFIAHAINCAYASGFLMRTHKSLRKAALNLLPWKRLLEMNQKL